MEEEILLKLEALVSSLLKSRDDAIKHRATSGVERRWSEDAETFNLGIEATEGERLPITDYASGVAPVRGGVTSGRSSVVVNIIRGKCEIAEGRFSAIQLPVDCKNWGLKVTPRVKGDREQIKEKMVGMENAIDDQLTECGFNAESRKCVKDAVRMGTGILKGPQVVKRIVPRWEEVEGGFKMSWEEKFTPESKRVDPWNVYPDQFVGEDISKAAYIWEVRYITSHELRALIGVPGYFDTQIIKALQEKPSRTNVSRTAKDATQIQKDIVDKGQAYELWEYYGDMSREDLELLGCPCDEYEDVSFSVCVMLINEKPIKVVINPLDIGGHPYDFFQWTVVAGTPWGIGVPRIGRWLQRIITAAWRAIMDNAGNSAGPTIVVNKGVEPADGNWNLAGPKIWEITGDDLDDARKAFTQFQIKNNQVELQNIIELALKFTDIETTLPMFFQGEKGTLPETLGATNIMVDSSNVTLRNRVKLWDDQVTVPHLVRYYHWNMQYNDDQDIKGDYAVDARGSSVLLERDQRSKAIMDVMQLKADPDINSVVDWQKAAKQLFASLHLDIVMSDDEIKDRAQQQQQQPQAAPDTTALDVATIRVEGDLQKIEKQIIMEKEKQEFHRLEAEKQREHESILKDMDYQIKMMEMSEKTGINLDKIKADLSKDAAKLNLQERLSLNKAGEAISPAVEPPGRAPDGESFVK